MSRAGAAALALAASAWAPPGLARPSAVRVATFNLEDVRPEHVATRDDPRLKRLALVIQALRPDIILLNEIAPEQADGAARARPERTARLFAERYIGDVQDERIRPVFYNAFATASNTGVHSGLDLDRNGAIDAKPGSRDYGGDSLGYGEFPGHYGMALLLREGFTVAFHEIRTFGKFLWKDMPGAILPSVSEDRPDRGWYTPEMLAVLPLSSKNHWDFPARLPSGAVVHLLCSHPTPPVFDGPEDRNGRRNHDEIRLWADYIGGAPYVKDDRGKAGGLDPAAHFVILGDLNADPAKGDSRDNPIANLLFKSARVSGEFTPRSVIETPRLEPTDTAAFGLRVDYVLPSRSLKVLGGGVLRGPEDVPALPDGAPAPALPRFERFPSDHFPVWLDIEVPDP